MNDFWTRYYPFFDPRVLDGVLSTETISVDGEEREIDVYQHPQPAPVIVFTIGLGGYARFGAPLCHRMFSRGYHVIAVNLPGHNGAARAGDFTLPACVRTIRAAAAYARQRFGTPVFLAGGSIGGALTYYAVAEGEPARAIACYCAWEFSAHVLHPALLKAGPVATALQWLLARLNACAPRLRPPTPRLLWQRLAGIGLPKDWFGCRSMHADPRVAKGLSIRALHDLSTYRPATPFSEFSAAPVQVSMGMRDRLLDIAVMRAFYDQLKVEKQLVLLDQEHWPVYEHEIRQTADAFCDWFDRWR